MAIVFLFVVIPWILIKNNSNYVPVWFDLIDTDFDIADLVDTYLTKNNHFPVYSESVDTNSRQIANHVPV